MTRKEARQTVMTALFQMEIQNEWNENSIEGFLGEKPLGNQKEYIVNTVKNYVIKKEEFDSRINNVSEGWPIERIAKTDLAIIRTALSEIDSKAVPKAVAVNEAVELSKIFSSDNGPKFVNAILGKL